MRPLQLGAVAAVVILICDQITKVVLLNWLDGIPLGPGRHVTVLPVLDFVVVWNRGISFGLLDGTPLAASGFLIALALAVTAIMVVWLFRTPERHMGLALGLIIGGAIGNVIDRVRFGAVFDFVHFHIDGVFSYPAFNVADAAITIGVIVILLYGTVFGRSQTTASDSQRTR